jgi:two-component system NarL family sensor kinase
MDEVSTLGQAAESRAAVTLVRDHLEPIRAAWHALIAEQTRLAAGLPTSALNTYLVSFVEYLERPDPLIPARVAALWHQEVEPSRETISVTAVAIGLLSEALRLGVPEDVLEPVQSGICAALGDYSAEVVRGLIGAVDLSPGEQHWYEVSRQLVEERERRITQLGILNEVSMALASTLSLDDLYDIIHEQVGRLVDNSNFYIATTGPTPGTMIIRLYYFKGQRRHDLAGQVVEAAFSRRVLAQAEPVMVDDYVAACRELGIPIQPPELEAMAPLAWLGVPIVSGNKAIGIITVATNRGTFDRDDSEILAAIARQAGVAIENARLFHEQLVQAQQLRAINDLSRAVATIREPWPLLDRAAELIRELFGYSLVAIFVAQPDDDRLVLRAQVGMGQPGSMYGLTLRIGQQGIIGHAAATGEVILVNDVLNDSRYISIDETAHIRSEIAVPLLRDDRLLGVLDVESAMTNAFDQRDVELLKTAADQLAIALENADLLYQESKRRSEMAIVMRATQAANSTLVLDHVLQHVAEGIADAVGLPSCVIYLFDDEGDRLLPSAYVAREGSLLDTSRIHDLLPVQDATQLLQFVRDSGSDACSIDLQCCDGGVDLSQVLNASAVLAVPFVVKGRLLGVALVPAHEPGYQFASHQLRIAYGVASAAALALENARLYARSHTLGMAEERIRVARDIHDGMAQGLTAIALQLEAAEQMLRSKPDKAQAKIARALELARTNLEEARRSVLDLRASALEELTLSEALQRRMQQFNDEHREQGLTGACMTQLRGRLSSRVELSLFRVFEEALDNISRHSGASRVTATLNRDNGSVTLTVSDNGRGFDAIKALAGGPEHEGFGLVAIRERIRLLHGAFSIVSPPDGSGTTLQVVVPFEPHRESVDDERGEASAKAQVIEVGSGPSQVQQPLGSGGGES